MKSVFSEWDPKPEDADYDLILDIRRKIAKLPIKATGRHVEGHQDDPRKRSGPPKSLDRWAKLNVEMDARAKKLLRQRVGHHYANIPLVRNTWWSNSEVRNCHASTWTLYTKSSTVRRQKHTGPNAMIFRRTESTASTGKHREKLSSDSPWGNTDGWSNTWLGNVRLAAFWPDASTKPTPTAPAATRTTKLPPIS
jgi:hypothetical protein